MINTREEAVEFGKQSFMEYGRSLAKTLEEAIENIDDVDNSGEIVGMVAEAWLNCILETSGMKLKDAEHASRMGGHLLSHDRIVPK